MLTIAVASPARAEGVWDLGPVPIRGYALCIIAGHRRRDLDRRAPLGGPRRPARRGQRPRRLGGAVRPRRRPALPRRSPTTSSTSARAAAPVTALYIWQGGLGIWGAIALGALGVVIGARRQGDPAAAGARRDGARRAGRAGASAAGATGSTRSCSAARPTCRGRWRSTPRTGRRATSTPHDLPPDVPLRVPVEPRGRSRVVIWADRRFRLGHGRVVALYVMVYTLGRGWIEMLRIDDVQMQTTCSACGSTCGPRSCCSSPPAVYFVVVGAAPPRPRGAASTPAVNQQPERDRHGRHTPTRRDGRVRHVVSHCSGRVDRVVA